MYRSCFPLGRGLRVLAACGRHKEVIRSKRIGILATLLTALIVKVKHNDLLYIYASESSSTRRLASVPCPSSLRMAVLRPLICKRRKRDGVQSYQYRRSPRPLIVGEVNLHLLELFQRYQARRRPVVSALHFPPADQAVDTRFRSEHRRTLSLGLGGTVIQETRPTPSVQRPCLETRGSEGQ